MRHRVAFLGSRRWLNSRRIQRISLDQRITTVAARQVSEHSPGRSSDITIAVVQLGVNVFASLAVIESMSRPNSPLRCIAVSRSSDDGLLRGCVEAGAWALILASADAGKFLGVIHAVGAGRLAYPQDVLDRIVTYRGRMTLTPASAQLVW